MANENSVRKFLQIAFDFTLHGKHYIFQYYFFSSIITFEARPADGFGWVWRFFFFSLSVFLSRLNSSRFRTKHLTRSSRRLVVQLNRLVLNCDYSDDDVLNRLFGNTWALWVISVVTFWKQIKNLFEYVYMYVYRLHRWLASARCRKLIPKTLWLLVKTLLQMQLIMNALFYLYAYCNYSTTNDLIIWIGMHTLPHRIITTNNAHTTRQRIKPATQSI